MKYSVKLKIDKPISEVVALFEDRKNDRLWMEGFVEKIPIKGEEGELGAKCKVVFEMGKRKMEMIEEITEKNLPESYVTTYTTPSVFNIVKNKFITIDGNTTLYQTNQEFQFKTFVMKIMGALMPGAFKKQSMKYLKAFKAFAEKQ
jgi:hypothetical protein